MKNAKIQRGVSLIEVSLYIMLFSVSLITFSHSMNNQLNVDKVDEVASGIRQFNHALTQYMIDHQVELLSSESNTPHTLYFSDLKKMEYLPDQMKDANFMTFSSTGYVFKQNVANINGGIGRPQIVGIVMTCPKDGVPTSRFMLNRIENQLGASEGIMNANGSSIIGNYSSWVIYKDDVISDIPLFGRTDNCIYSLLTDVLFFHEKGANHSPDFQESQVIVEAFSAGNKSQIQEGGVWRPLFTTDTINLINNNSSKHIRVDLVDENNVLFYSNYFNSSDVAINPATFAKEKNPESIFGKSFKIKITPLDDFGHQGNSVYLFNNTAISIKRYEGVVLKSLSFKMGFNIYNKNYQVPLKPVGSTRSDVGYCADKNNPDVITPMGMDIVGMAMTTLIPEKKNASYIEPQVITVVVDNSATSDGDSDSQINTDRKTILAIKLNSPTDWQSGTMSWGSYDRRFTQTPFIGSAILSKKLFYLLSDACQSSMKGNASVYIEINNKLIKTFPSMPWDAGKSSTWGFNNISIK